MRILVVCYEFPPVGGGTGVACEQVVREIAADGSIALAGTTREHVEGDGPVPRTTWRSTGSPSGSAICTTGARGSSRAGWSGRFVTGESSLGGGV